MSRKQRVTYSVEFKKDAVKLVTEKGYTRKEAAESLGVSISSLNLWIRMETGKNSSGSGGSLGLDEREELKRLRKENKRLNMERDILKKAAVFFAKENE